MSARSKGSGFERKVAKLIVAAFAEAFPKKNFDSTDCWRTPLSGGHFAASKTDPGDIQFSPRLKRLFPFSVECKFYRRLHWHRLMTRKKKKGHWNTWWKQCVKAAVRSETTPVLVVKENGGPPYVLMISSSSPRVPTLSTRLEGDIVAVRLLDDFLKEYVQWKRSELQKALK